MKGFLNLLIEDSEVSTIDEITDNVLTTLEENGIKVIWHKASLPNDK